MPPEASSGNGGDSPFSPIEEILTELRDLPLDAEGNLPDSI